MKKPKLTKKSKLKENKKEKMKKLLGIVVLCCIFTNVNATEIEISQLDKLFIQLKDTQKIYRLLKYKKEIWEIWLIHPSE